MISAHLLIAKEISWMLISLHFSSLTLLKYKLSVIKDEIEALSKNLDYKQCKDIKKTLNVILDGDYEEFKKKIEHLKPIILEQIKANISNSIFLKKVSL